MAKSGPIIIVEDDADDEAVFSAIVQELNIPNKIVWFSDPNNAIDYLKKTTEQPFIIFSDVNLLRENGIEFKRRIDNDKQLRENSTPFVFYSTFANRQIVNKAYSEMTVQGFFKKGKSYTEIRDDIRLIVEYRRMCKHPNI
jgi:two-component SAPR family response regulator